MPSATYAHLTDRSLIRVAGDEATHFLQNLVTSDLDNLGQLGAASAALLTPQGKILFDFLIYKLDDVFYVDAPSSIAPDLLKRLTFYRLRAKVDLEAVDAEIGVFAFWGDGNTTNEGLLTVNDPRLETLGQRVVGQVDLLSHSLDGAPADLAAYDTHRIALGVPEGLKDYDYSDIFPHDADLDQLNGVSFTKGCYVGQEVVSRVQHRGTARKRFVKVASGSDLPAKGTDLTAAGKSVGTLGSTAISQNGSIGLALIRLDKVAQAKDNGSPLLCGDVEVGVALPDWAQFTWPETSAVD
ncbi:folate-binding protein YgfZ [uncultured Roseibium sp.]|uniref:CAF17-like 4Fe-4S cluster assembly/insertion protein YgfZ n=1 Tax=uncultured Roseibium sp. TaxID=1936171 RepID=UPI002625F3C6|nr:folate-binding protein YgfZ [uncultured Roseibium sp.]